MMMWERERCGKGVKGDEIRIRRERERDWVVWCFPPTNRRDRKQHKKEREREGKVKERRTHHHPPPPNTPFLPSSSIHYTLFEPTSSSSSHPFIANNRQTFHSFSHKFHCHSLLTTLLTLFTPSSPRLHLFFFMFLNFFVFHPWHYNTHLYRNFMEAISFVFRNVKIEKAIG